MPWSQNVMQQLYYLPLTTVFWSSSITILAEQNSNKRTVKKKTSFTPFIYAAVTLICTKEQCYLATTAQWGVTFMFNGWIWRINYSETFAKCSRSFLLKSSALTTTRYKKIFCLSLRKSADHRASTLRDIASFSSRVKGLGNRSSCPL